MQNLDTTAGSPNTMNSEAGWPTLAAAIAAFIKVIVEEHNAAVRRDDDAYYAANPDETRVPSEQTSLQEAMREFALAIHTDSEIAREIADGIVAAVDKEAPLDPWPELDRKELRFLIGDRAFGRAGPNSWPLWEAILPHRMRSGDPLTLNEKLVAHSHRRWLEKDADKRRSKLAKAKAIVEAMEGKAA